MQERQTPGLLTEAIRREENIFQAHEGIPSLRFWLGQIIRDHIDQPDIKEVENFFWKDPSSNLLGNFSTILTASIPVRGREIEVEIASTLYPMEYQERGDLVSVAEKYGYRYKIAIHGLDYNLVIEKDRAWIESNESEPDVPYSVRIKTGVAYSSHAKWKREMNMKDFRRYVDVLAAIVTNPEVEFRGRTAPLYDDRWHR